MTTEPITFISHSACDDVFCKDLYDALCLRGVRPIMDKRDFQPGDDLVKRIFDEGISVSDAVIFVLSPGSVDRPWVRKELSVSVVHEITSRTRLIPVLIDGLADDRVPPPLAATIWIRATAETSVDEIARQIANAVHADKAANPVIADPPEWTKEAISKMNGLAPVDEIVLAFVCEQVLATDHPHIGTRDILNHEPLRGISEAELETSLAILRQNGYTKPGLRGRGTTMEFAVTPSTHGMRAYLKAYRPQEYATLFKEVVAAMVNGRASDLAAMAAVVDAGIPIVRHVIDVLDEAGDIKTARAMGGIVAWHIMPTLRRRL